jgi:predicted cupin superfamily sugar epimerase
VLSVRARVPPGALRSSSPATSHPDGRDELIVLGPQVVEGQEVQHVVPAGTWMGARLRPGGEYGVWGNTMAPGFVLGNFEGASAEDLVARWPHRADLIAALTR